jgi:hypothetical protein
VRVARDRQAAGFRTHLFYDDIKEAAPMPTFEDPAVDADMARSAQRSLAHATQAVHPLVVVRGLSL